MRNPYFLGRESNSDDRRAESQINETREFRIRAAAFAFSGKDFASESQSLELYHLFKVLEQIRDCAKPTLP